MVFLRTCVILKILALVTDLEEEKSNLNYRAAVVALWYLAHFFAVGAVDG